MQRSSYENQQDLLSEEMLSSPPQFAGFWLRFAAYVIDTIVVYIACFFLLLVLYLSGFQFQNTNDSKGAMELFSLFLFLAVLLYFPVMESSKWQATLGKRAVGIQVTDLYGTRISFGKALGRFVSKFLSALTFCFGFAMAGFTPKKQGLHDMIAGALVIRN